MATFYNPKIITDGLVLALDAANSKSYPGSGTTWNDLSSNKSNASLLGGVTFGASNKGVMIFDGTDDHVDFSAPSLSTTATVEMWAKPTSLSDRMFFGWLAYDIYCLSGQIGYNTASSDIYGLNSSVVTSLGLLNNWHHYVFEMRSDVSYTNNKIYIDGVSQTLSQQLGTEAPANRTFNSGNGRIAGWRTNTSYRMPMECPIFKVYNRSLAAAEIQQNFNALRGRFNI
jgi:hypothetical protein